MYCGICKHPEDPPTRKKFTNSWFGGETVCLSYLLYRWFLSFFFLLALVQSIVQNTVAHGNISKYFIYLTNNARWLAWLTYTLDAALVSTRYFKESRGTYKEHIEEAKSLPLSQKVLWYLHNCQASLSLMITIVYWTLLYSPVRHSLDFENFTGHLLTGVVSIMDVFISDRPWKLVHFIQPVLFAAHYCVFSYIYYLSGGTNYYQEPFIYPILDWTKPIQTFLVMLSVGIFISVIHVLFYTFYRMRLVLKQKYLRFRKNFTPSTLTGATTA